MSPPQPFRVRFEVRWADLDANRHLKNTAYSEMATHTRFSFLAGHGFPSERFGTIGLGPVILREETRYLREAHLGDTLELTVELAGASEDASHFLIGHDVLRGRIRLARVEVEGGWMNLATRRLAVPPTDLRATLEQFPKPADFQLLHTLVSPKATTGPAS